jgi:hypothetical protein
VLAADRAMFSAAGLWTRAEARLERLPKALVRVELGIVRDRIGLERLQRAAPDVARVVAFGNSRANDGFIFPERVSGLELARLVHAPLSPLELRLFAHEAVAHRSDLLVVMLSEFDTHRPVRIVPRAGFADARATAGIALSTVTGRPGWSADFLTTKRVELERLALAAACDAYRYRDVLERAWGDALSFRPGHEGRLPLLESRELDEPDALAGAAPALAEIRARFRRTVPDRYPDSTLTLLQGIRPGPHVQANAELVADALAILRAGGCSVLIVEGPLHPFAYELYDRAATRAQFLELVRRLERDLGAHVLTLEDSGPYGETDFTDPLHLRRRRGRELGALVVRNAGTILAARGPADAAVSVDRPGQ